MIDVVILLGCAQTRRNRRGIGTMQTRNAVVGKRDLINQARYQC